MTESACAAAGPARNERKPPTAPAAPSPTAASAASAVLTAPAGPAAPTAVAGPAAPVALPAPVAPAAPAPPAPAAPAAPATLDRRLIALLALTCAIAVGNIYFPQAVSPLVAAALGTSPDKAAVVVTATQIGYTAGIFLLVPLGDRLPCRRLLVALLAASGAALLAASLARSLTQLATASALVGVTTTAAQLIGPMTVGLVAEGRRGAVMGTLLSGSIGGMLLARTFGGALGERFGWRSPYLVAGLVVLCLAVVLARALPATPAAAPPRTPLRSLPVRPLRLLCAEPELRRSAWYQAALFGGFSAAWTCLALLLTGPLYGFGPQALGLVALTGVITMACTPVAGRIVDRIGPDRVSLACFLATLAAAAVLAAGARGGTAGLVALVLGTLLLDTAMQCGMIANQARFYALRSDSRSALNTAYMTCAYLGGSAGSWLGLQLYRHGGWLGVCLLLALLTAPAADSFRRVRAAKRQGGFLPAP